MFQYDIFSRYSNHAMMSKVTMLMTLIYLYPAEDASIDKNGRSKNIFAWQLQAYNSEVNSITTKDYHTKVKQIKYIVHKHNQF